MKPIFLLSVIIPTYLRPKYLVRAIESSLKVGASHTVEVIVVPNGNDKSWLGLKNRFKSNHNVRWLPLDKANVSAARNHGLKAAQGLYVRFLDDDDYLCTEACQGQLEAALQANADICSGSLGVVNRNGHVLHIKHQPDTNDICAAACGPSRLVQIGAHMFKRELAQSVMWNVERTVAEDVQWFIEVATQEEANWIKTSEVVSVWVQHGDERLSVGHDPGGNTLEYFSKILLQAASHLERTNRLTSERRIALADGLWSLLQKGLRYDYKYWKKIASIANHYAPDRTPPSKIYRYKIIQRLDPLFVESILIPIRLIYHPVRKLLEKLNIGRA